MNNLLFLKTKKGNAGTDKIREQARLWDMYAKISPIVFVIVMGVLWFLDLVHHTHILWAGAILFGITAITWLFWTVLTIGKIASLLRNADKGVQDALHNLRDIKDLVKQMRD